MSKVIKDGDKNKVYGTRVKFPEYSIVNSPALKLHGLPVRRFSLIYQCYAPNWQDYIESIIEGERK
jgi:hypothetical protein